MLPILTLLWPFLETVIKKNKRLLGKYPEVNDLKLQRNLISALNAGGTVIFGLLYLKFKSNSLFLMSLLYPTMYYIYDAYYIWFHKVKEHYPYFLHHGATIYLLQSIYSYEGIVRDVMIQAVVGLELTNLPLLYTYHFLKSNQVKDITYYEKLMKVKLIQLAFYFIIRIIFFGFLIKKYGHHIKHQPIFSSSLFVLYLMGLYWVVFQIKGYMKSRNEWIALQKREKDDKK